MYIHVCDQNDNATYASTRWVPTVRHFLVCEDIVGGSQQSGGKHFFAKYSGPSGGSLLSGGGIIILRVIRRHFLACGHGPSCRPLHVQSTSDACQSLTTSTRPRQEHQGSGRRRGLGRERHGAREYSAVISHVEEYEGLLVRLPSPENNNRCG